MATEKYRTSSGYIEEVVQEELFRLGNDEQRTAFAKAIMMSIRLDRSISEPPQPYSASEIKEETGFSIKIQKDKRILLSKNDAIQFLQKFGLGISSTSSFKKRYNKPNYQKFFLREAPQINKRALVCTYAEWLHLEGYLFEPEFPQVLVEYLPDPNWRPFRRRTTLLVDTNLLSKDIESTTQNKVRAATQRFMEALDFQQQQEFNLEKSSFHQQIQYVAREIISQEDLEQKFSNARELLSAKFQESENDSNDELNAASQAIVESLSDVSEAVIKLGKIYIVRTTNGEDKVTDVAMETLDLKEAYQQDLLRSEREKYKLLVRNPQRIKELL